jgi:sodium-dependent dicarboxylate transporter 2/3/5
MNAKGDSASDLVAPPAVRVARFGLALGPLLAAAAYVALRSASDLSRPAQATAAVGVLMAVWWMTEAIPLAATRAAVLSLPRRKTSRRPPPYADESIFLYLGDFSWRWRMQRAAGRRRGDAP